MRIDPAADRALIAAIAPADATYPRGAARPLGTARIPRPRSPSMQLLDAVMRLAGPEADLLRHAERPWASATFQGTRHTIALCFSGTEGIGVGEAFIAALPEHEFTISRQLVADAAISEVDHEMQPQPHLTVEVDILWLEDC